MTTAAIEARRFIFSSEEKSIGDWVASGEYDKGVGAVKWGGISESGWLRSFTRERRGFRMTEYGDRSRGIGR